MTLIARTHRHAATLRRLYPSWRKGQAYFNALAAIHPILAGRLRGTDLDPFYDDARLRAFVAAVCEYDAAA